MSATVGTAAERRRRVLNGAVKAWLLRLHRWVALVFGLPLLAVVASGLVLSVEPLVTSAAIKPGSVTSAVVEAALQRHDPGGRARGLVVRPYEGTIALQGVRSGAPLVVDAVTGEEVPAGGASLSAVFGTARRVHERLLLETTSLVVASTAAMLAIMAFGIAMGLPRLRNTLGGWHKGVAWFLLPLLLLSPATGLLMAFGITLAPAPVLGPEGRARAAPVPLAEAVRVVGAAHDLSAVSWIRVQAGRTVARVNEGGELRVYAVGREGLVPQPRNWPRLIHEGTLSATWGSLVNLAVSVALLVLLGTGTWLWARRRLRVRVRRRDEQAA